ncbi:MULTISPECIES: helix-turn-helix transcriptional regulator [unclassified Streptomyces]|uniref:helix-turn-helix domain-containing protein n=1 Tax=unclassified Streptomyces TaxID=2593676 RepID=UPI00081E48C9|nr:MULTISPECIES: helix-turn-helix transcriptional regulator [unclassified Streptomyces]MYZ35480.1 helix-turn-helix domain-containing protein [Streptomyces sp. SID4917]SCF75801.1 Helix-turn-helix domain-containing protein [Streptomyces sp. MnatMP-M17]
MSRRGLWTDVRLRAAYARGDWAAVLREYRRTAGITQVALESLLGMPQPHISAIESGRRKVKTASVRARITEGLQVPAEVIEAGQSATYGTWEPSPELRERVAHGHATGRTDLRTADWIGQVLATQRRAEDDGSGHDLWPVVRSQLDAVTRLIPGTSGPAADRLLLLAAEHAHWLSWVAWQQRRAGAALGWLDVAYGWATDGAHADMASWLLRVRANYSRKGGDPVRALRTADAARTVSGLSPAAVSAASHEASVAAAAVGERDRARRLAETALRQAVQVPDEEDRPGWLYWLTPTRAQLQAADAAYARREWRTAADQIRAALPDLEGVPRDRAHFQARMEDAERRAG